MDNSYIIVVYSNVKFINFNTEISIKPLPLGSG